MMSDFAICVNCPFKDFDYITEHQENKTFYQYITLVHCVFPYNTKYPEQCHSNWEKIILK